MGFSPGVGSTSSSSTVLQIASFLSVRGKYLHFLFRFVGRRLSIQNGASSWSRFLNVVVLFPKVPPNISNTWVVLDPPPILVFYRINLATLKNQKFHIIWLTNASLSSPVLPSLSSPSSCRAAYSAFLVSLAMHKSLLAFKQPVQVSATCFLIFIFEYSFWQNERNFIQLQSSPLFGSSGHKGTSESLSFGRGSNSLMDAWLPFSMLFITTFHTWYHHHFAYICRLV